MRRNIVLTIAFGLAICAGALPLLAAVYISRERAFALERRHLADYADWTVQRGDLNIARARAVLKVLAAENRQSCTPDDIARLQKLTTDALSVDEIAVTNNGQLVCDTWGLARTEATLFEDSIALSEGYELRLNGGGLSDPVDGMIVVSQGNYHALLKRERLVDVLHDTPMLLGIASLDGQPIALSGAADPQLVSRLVGQETSGFNDRQVFSSRRGKDFAAFAISNRSVVDWRTDAELWKMIPVGIGISLGLIALIAWVSRQRLSLAGELAIGIRRKEFVAHYQPIIDLATGRCIGAEALIRWQRPDGSSVRPDLFIPVAEQNGMIGQITEIMVRNVLETMKDALAEHRDMHVAINISPQDVEDGRFLTQIDDQLRTMKVQTSQIWLEVTERGFIQADAASATLTRARDAGHVIAIDDFGTGYSSLSMLQSLPVTVLKIDKSFIDALGRNAATSLVTPHIIEMAHSLKLKMVAEGIETAEQEAVLHKAGVQYGQGWLYSKALPFEDFMAFYERRNADIKGGAKIIRPVHFSHSR
ncbi:EAL domain-containing protein [Rhizobium sp. RM]|uniref:EAL domain-containing protein n=1 Tax=Rhizobium sp. RM TaxID=2748079 RepID=UPI00110DB194|nr:EAL domain-containing protein [Rhizobium sp. RM]NWJ26101.1 EAL domain-containing protein [Rhizobium sp. RM]TMV20698.1 EAL domain-containing protein [Rhizobium sp. Td3]